MQQVADSAAPASFGTLLRSWRAARRLSQLELSLGSGVSQRHLSFLESGRSRPSQRMVIELGEALELPLRERNALLLAAGFAACYRERSLDAEAMAPVTGALREDPSLPAHWHVPDPDAGLAPVLPLVFGSGELEFSLFTMISTFGTPHDVTTDELRVEAFFPADAATERRLRQLAEA